MIRVHVSMGELELAMKAGTRVFRNAYLARPVFVPSTKGVNVPSAIEPALAVLSIWECCGFPARGRNSRLWPLAAWSSIDVDDMATGLERGEGECLDFVSCREPGAMFTSGRKLGKNTGVLRPAWLCRRTEVYELPLGVRNVELSAYISGCAATTVERRYC